MHFTVLAFGIAVIICGLLFAKRNSRAGTGKAGSFRVSKNFKVLSMLAFLASFACAILEWRANGFNISLLQSSGTDIKNEIVSLPIVHYGTVFLPYCALISLYRILFCKGCFRPYHYFVIGFAVFYSLLIQVSRGTLLLILLGTLPLLQERLHLKLRHFIGMAAAIGFILLGIILVRVPNRESLVYSAVEADPFISAIYTYIATCYDNLNTLVREGTQYSLSYAALLKPVFKVLNIQFDVPYVEYDLAFFNARTMLYGFYHDLGILGVMLYTFPIYFAVGLIYYKSKRERIYLVLFAALQKPIFCIFFGNYFTGAFITMFPSILIWIMILLSRDGGIRYEKAYERKSAA